MQTFAVGVIAIGLTAAAIAAPARADISGPPANSTAGPQSKPQLGPQASPVINAPVDRAMEARLIGTTIRAQVWDGFLSQNHIHRFRADGTVTGQFAARRLILRGIDFINEYDQGRWSVTNGRLCVTWRKFFGGRSQCYELEPVRPGWVRFANISGGPSFNAQVD